MSVNFSGIVPNNASFNTRIVQDNNYIVSVALPATATTANTNGLDLVQAVPYPTTETVNVEVSTTASANGNSVNGTIVLQDTVANSDGTANSANWTNIATLGTTQITEGSSSTVAVSATYKLPPGCRRFIRAQVTLPSNTADLSDATATLKLLF